MTNYEIPDGWFGMECVPRDNTQVNVCYIDGSFWSARFKPNGAGGSAYAYWQPITPPKVKRWRAEGGMSYHYVTDRGTASYSNEDDTTIDDYRYKCGNYYQTRELAEAAAERVRKVYVGGE